MDLTSRKYDRKPNMGPNLRRGLIPRPLGRGHIAPTALRPTELVAIPFIASRGPRVSGMRACDASSSKLVTAPATVQNAMTGHGDSIPSRSIAWKASEVIACGTATLVVLGPTELPFHNLLECNVDGLRVCRLAAGLVRDLDVARSARSDTGPLLIYPAASNHSEA